MFGNQGILGNQGTIGIQGAQGTQAAQGTQGIYGIQGLSGYFSGTNIVETIGLSGSGASGTITIYVQTESLLYYSGNAGGNVTFNITASAGTTLNSYLTIGQSISVVFMMTNGSSAYYVSTVQVDGTTVTPKYSGGTAPTGGDTNAIDVYSFTVIKTGNAAFAVLGSQTKFS